MKHSRHFTHPFILPEPLPEPEIKLEPKIGESEASGRYPKYGTDVAYPTDFEYLEGPENIHGPNVRVSGAYGPRKRMYRRRRSSYGRYRRPYRRSYRSYSRFYRPRRRYYRGRGAYYLSAAGNLQGNVGIGKFNVGARGGVVHGLGAYDMSNISHNTIMKPDVPEIRNAAYAEGATIIRHREYIGPITTSSTAGRFNIQSYSLNPAQSGPFPWLSQIAQNFEEYRPNGLLFEFRSTASDAIASSTNLALGQVMLCTQYDPTDPEFDTDVQMLNYSWAQSGKVSDNLMHFVECDPKQSPMSHLYTRTGTESSPSDLRFSDFGRFSIATSGLQGTSVQIGQLWVSYEFLLYKPKVGSDSATGGGIFMYTNRSGSVTSAVIWGATLDSGELYDGNNIDITLGYNEANYPSVTFPLSSVNTSYMVDILLYGDSTASVSTISTNTVGGNIQRYAVWDDATYSVSTPSVAATSFSRGYKVAITVLAEASDISDNKLVLYSAGTSPANTSCCIVVTEIPVLDTSIAHI